MSDGLVVVEILAEDVRVRLFDLEGGYSGHIDVKTVHSSVSLSRDLSPIPAVRASAGA